MTQSRPLISVIVGSIRPVRVGRDISDAIAAVVADTVDADVRVLDLAEIALPLLDEPLMPAMGQYQHEHTRAWSQTISESDGVIFVTPQYNAGYPAALKNAIDYLYAEWKQRPSAIVSYGGGGGPQAAKQLREVIEFIGLDVTAEQVAITLAPTDYSAEWHLNDATDVVSRYKSEIEELANALHAKADARLAVAA